MDSSCVKQACVSFQLFSYANVLLLPKRKYLYPEENHLVKKSYSRMEAHEPEKTELTKYI